MHKPAPMPSVFARAVHALMLREMATRYSRTPGGYVWAVLHPLGVIIVLAYAFALLQKNPALGTSFLLFKATGFLAVRCFTHLGSVTGHALDFSRSLLLYPKVAWIDAVMARFLLNFLIVTMAALLILCGIMVYDGVEPFIDWPLLILAWGIAAWLGLSLGMLNCYLFQRFEIWQQIWGILTAPLFLISGVILLFEDMPPAAQAVLWFNPLLHVTGMMRAAFYPIYRPDYISLVYLGLWCILPFLLGLMLMHLFHRDLLARKR